MSSPLCDALTHVHSLPIRCRVQAALCAAGVKLAPGALHAVQQLLAQQKADLNAEHGADKRAAVAAARHLACPAGSPEADDVVDRVWPTLGTLVDRESAKLRDVSERRAAQLLSGELPADVEPHLCADVLDDLADEAPHLTAEFGRLAGRPPPAPGSARTGTWQSRAGNDWLCR